MEMVQEFLKQKGPGDKGPKFLHKPFLANTVTSLGFCQRFESTSWCRHNGSSNVQDTSHTKICHFCKALGEMQIHKRCPRGQYQ